jgi:hypothetical protein
MKLQFLELPPDERAMYFQQAGAQRNVSPVLLEKDFWVSWLLGVLFNSEFGPSLVFKGGTSLSKVFRAIDRFSEDIDLSLSPQFLILPPAGDTRNKANQWMRQAEAACARVVEHQIMPALDGSVRRFLGTKATPWFEFVADPVTHSPVLLFQYPTSQPDGFAYLKRSVKLEFGSLTDQQPTGRHAISPLITDILPSAELDWQCEVVALELERSFWEKATILHAEYHRPAERPTPDRFSRHYADTAALALHPIADVALKDHALRDRVVAWKGQFFGSAWARYDLAAPGTFRLVPPSSRLGALRADYDAMGAMYMSEPMTFDSILAYLAELEARINAGA